MQVVYARECVKESLKIIKIPIKTNGYKSLIGIQKGVI
jgi:hypothetical protein